MHVIHLTTFLTNRKINLRYIRLVFQPIMPIFPNIPFTTMSSRFLLQYFRFRFTSLFFFYHSSFFSFSIQYTTFLLFYFLSEVLVCFFLNSSCCYSFFKTLKVHSTGVSTHHANFTKCTLCFHIFSFSIVVFLISFPLIILILL